MPVIGMKTMEIVAPQGLHDAATNELLAMLEVMYLVAVADGFFSQDERTEFLKIVQSLSEGKIGAPQLGQMVDNWVRQGSGNVEERLDRVAGMLPDETSRRIAYGLAMQIAEVDGKFLESEAHMLRRIAAVFELEEGAPEEIAHSVRMSRRPVVPQ